ncbi:MlaD family protein, partial [Phycicoccus sp. Soil748]|uniref:MlaD family protein n=1 Tax=Phycicoccus sp. Soil748 TaxID=1736397 RepID=UPI000B07F625
MTDTPSTHEPTEATEPTAATEVPEVTTIPERPVGPARGAISHLGNKAYGVGFLVIVTLLLGLSVAAFQKRFTPVVEVTLLTDRIGSQLQEASDVKLRGVIVGEVRSIEVTARGARLGLALKPEMVGMVPAGVSA